jgi:hypothetical protein
MLGEDQVLLEVKTLSSLPLWLTKLLSENKIFHTTFSKYGTAYCAIQENEGKGRCSVCSISSSQACLTAARLPA